MEYVGSTGIIIGSPTNNFTTVFVERIGKMDTLPEWMENLDAEDLTFIEKFLLASGSLKEIAKLYGVSYPTVRLRLDRLIQKINLSERTEDNAYISLIQKMAIEEKISLDSAKLLISEYKKQNREK